MCVLSRAPSAIPCPHMRGVVASNGMRHLYSDGSGAVGSARRMCVYAPVVKALTAMLSKLVSECACMRKRVCCERERALRESVFPHRLRTVPSA